MKRLCIMLLTYAESLESPRASYAYSTLTSALTYIHTSEEVAVHIADDGSPQEYRDFLRETAGGYSWVAAIGESNAERRGYGASYNLATQHIHPGTDYVLVLEDDWILNDRLYLDGHMRALDTGVFGCIRLGYLGTTQTLIGHVRHVADESYWMLHPDSPEPHVFAGHPRLETVAWQRQAGPWPEGLNPGETEFAVAQRVRNGIVYPVYNAQPFHHIGTVQARTDQGGVK